MNRGLFKILEKTTLEISKDNFIKLKISTFVILLKKKTSEKNTKK